MTLAWAPGIANPVTSSKAVLSCHRRRAADTKPAATANRSQDVRSANLLTILSMENLPQTLEQKLEALHQPSPFQWWKGNITKIPCPMTHRTSTIPMAGKRLSAEWLRLSPMTKMHPSGTVT